MLKDWKVTASWYLIPDYMREPIIKYVDEGVCDDEFLEAIFSNDLKGAFTSADYVNKRRIGHYVEFIMGYVPAIAHGSKDNFEQWCSIGGMNGYRFIRAEAEAA